MRIIDNLSEMTETARGWLAGGSVGFVPIMSTLHDGHSTLIRAALEECEIIVVSILECSLKKFDENSCFRSDFLRDLKNDLRRLSHTDVDVVFVPRQEDLYAPGFATYVTPIGPIAERLEARRRPDSVRRFATAITKLLQIIRPDVAYFGQKDAQQVAIVKQLVRDLNIDVSLRVLPTLRESSGLAISGRNSWLSAQERKEAALIYQALLAARDLIEHGERRASVIKKMIMELIASSPHVDLEYVAVCHPQTFIERQEAEPDTLLAIAVRVGGICLIDNILWMSDGQWRI
ncbi:pantoate--beta-alanine ligase [Ktedonosporobacter rubrisoli]|uniref:Pantothenate synthetase n=1 Tax=Ktedonosporobacter rubrisoli TaxID=2509675 RepID=A0A4P6JUR0_KTERU|nr:pantoate--beta-alanine ligase [Ktedonosporobacter rubrisoli]QBD79379.1 pantoate--beta-alanine ligase [Ktedonosporobacter rubrisoli]